MPRYYFHLLEECATNLVRDSVGASLRNSGEAKREAMALAQDIVRHRMHRSNWQIIVTDGNGNVVLSLPLSSVRPRRITNLLDQVRGFLFYEPRFRPQIFTWLLIAAVLALFIQSMVLSDLTQH